MALSSLPRMRILENLHCLRTDLELNYSLTITLKHLHNKVGFFWGFLLLVFGGVFSFVLGFFVVWVFCCCLFWGLGGFLFCFVLFTQQLC